MHVCVAPPLIIGALITSSVIWGDWLNKFYSFSVFQLTNAINKMDGRVALVTNTCNKARVLQELAQELTPVITHLFEQY